MTIFTASFDDELSWSTRRDGAVSLPPVVYTSDEVFELERDAVFGREWLPVCPAVEVPDQGSFLTRTILGEPLVVTRDDAGVVRALSAVCRHRGAHVADGCGTARALKCPYHAWSYRLDGTLIGTPDRPAGSVESADHSLRQFRTELWGGFVMVNFDDDAQPIADSYPLSTAAIANYRLDEPDVVHGAGPPTVHPWNWKLSVENILDVPHIPFLHRRFAGFLADDEPATASDGSHIEHLEPARGQLDLVSRVRAESDDYVTNVTGVHVLPPHRHLTSDDRSFGVNVAAGPALNLFLSPDTALYVTYLPVSATRTEVTYGGFWDGRARDLPHATYIIDQLLLDTALAVADEDIAVDTMVQISMHSREAPRGPLSADEHNLVLFNEWLVGRYREHWPGGG